METIRTRGLYPDDDKTFSPARVLCLQTAQTELHYLLNRGYPMKSAATFVSNHHQLSARHILALSRTTASAHDLMQRAETRLTPEDMCGNPIYIDGFNVLITLEVALSNGVLLLAQDESIRDLAALRGTYRLIPQTQVAIQLLRQSLFSLGVTHVTIFLDAPVSNSGNLKTAIYEKPWPMPVDVNLVRNPDAELKKRAFVASGDSIILDKCVSWFNLVAWTVETQGILPQLTRLVPLNTDSIEVP